MLFDEFIGPLSLSPKDRRVLVNVEVPGDIESFRYELNVPGRKSWAVVHLHGRWHAELVQGVPESTHLLFPGGGEYLYPAHKGTNKSCEIREFL